MALPMPDTVSNIQITPILLISSAVILAVVSINVHLKKDGITKMQNQVLMLFWGFVLSQVGIGMMMVYLSQSLGIIPALFVGILWAVAVTLISEFLSDKYLLIER